MARQLFKKQQKLGWVVLMSVLSQSLGFQDLLQKIRNVTVHCKQSIQLCRLLVMSGIIFALFVPNALAAPLDSYCIKKESESSAFKYRSPERTLKLTFSVKGEPFHLVADGSMVYLKRGNEAKPLMRAYAKQYEYGGIEKLTLSKNGWLLINATERDYIAHVDLDSLPPTLSSAQKLTELKRKPCSIFNIFCYDTAQGRYSSVLDRIFISGYRDTLFGSKDRTTLEIVDGKKRKLPRILQSAYFYADMPQLNGVLFRSTSGEALLYDGRTVTSLLKDFIKQSLKNKPAGWKLVKSKHTNGVFFANTGQIRHSEFLVGIKKDLTLKPIYTSLPEELSGSMRFYILPDDERLWGFHSKSIATEVNGVFRIVANKSEGYIFGVRRHAPDGSIHFSIKNSDIDSHLYYSIARTSSPDQCQIPLNSEKPFVLGSE